MKLLLSAILLLIAQTFAFAANPSYQAFRGAGGIIVTTNPPNGTVVIDGSGVVASGTNSSLQFSTSGVPVSVMASNLNLIPGNNVVFRGTNINSAAHINIGIASNLTFNGGGTMTLGTWGEVFGISNAATGNLSMWLDEPDIHNEWLFQDNIIVGGVVVATNVQLTAIPGSGNFAALTAAGQVYRTNGAGLGGTPGGQHFSVQYNSNGVFQGDTALQYHPIEWHGEFFGPSLDVGKLDASTNVMDPYGFTVLGINDMAFRTPGPTDTRWIISSTSGAFLPATSNSGSIGSLALPTATNFMMAFQMHPGAGAGKVLTSDGTGYGTWQAASGGAGNGTNTVSAGQSVSVVTNLPNYEVAVGLKDLLMSDTNRLTFSNGVGFAVSPDGITNNALYFTDTNGLHPQLIWTTASDGSFNGVGFQANPDFATFLDVVTTYSGTSLGTLRMRGILLTNAAEVGKVWTATSTDGSGAWSNAPAGSGGGGAGSFAVNDNQFVTNSVLNLKLGAFQTNLTGFGTSTNHGNVYLSATTPIINLHDPGLSRTATIRSGNGSSIALRTGIAGSNYDFESADGTAVRLRIVDTGNIGINNPTPTNSLDNSGNTSLRSNLWLSGHTYYLPDNTYDIGASGATRPRSLYVGTDINAGGAANITGAILGGSSVRAGSGSSISWASRGKMTSPSDGVITLTDTASGDFNRLQFGGTTAAFPAIGRTNGDLIVFGANGAFDGTSTNRLIVPGGLILPNLPTNASPVAFLAVDGDGKVFETATPAGSVGSTQMVTAAIGSLTMTNSILPSLSNNTTWVNLGTRLLPTGTNFMMSFQMHPGARRNLQLRSDDNGFGTWGTPQSGGNGNIAGGAEPSPGAINFAQTNVAGLHMMLDSTNNFVYWRNINEVAVTNTGGTSNTVIGAGYIRTQLLQADNFYVNTLVVTNGIPAAGATGDVQYKGSDGSLDAEAAFNYDDSDDILSVTTINSFIINASNIVATAPGSHIKGVTNGSDAAAGDIGERIISTNMAGSVGTTTTFYDVTSVNLTPGEWDITGIVTLTRNGSTFSAVSFGVGISTTAGNSSTGLLPAVNYSDAVDVLPVTFTEFTISVPNYRMPLTTNATIYLKGFVSTYSGAVPINYGRISARRTR